MLHFTDFRFRGGAFLLILSLIGCDRGKHSAQDTLRNTAEAAGQSTTVAADGLATGAQREAAQTGLSAALQARGLRLGKSFVAGDDSVRAGRPQLSLYVIFERTFRDTVRVRLLDNNGVEYGRSRVLLQGRADEARPFPVRFDPHMHFELGTQVVVE
ncbi:hypothetical protein [Hymenobacter nivis]|uniref:Uncharacterized protein n=1 Tax=Hymenobacter nivis TaxID=1850093 RepID=A0A2Z3GFZ0_9BACT|nr:hypothetical protein [Hymenobacter nivis]AWM31758.1 hypothetical protein DDQ68_02540 [Hymenobacter nivis]